MYWAPKRKRPLHSSAYRLILQWGRALRFDTAQAVAVHRSSGHAISHPLIVRQACCKCSCPGGPVCRKQRSQSFLWPFALKCLSTYSILHRPQSVRFSSVHAISQLLLQYKSVVRLFCFFSNSTFWVTLGLILGFLGKSCCSEKVN